MTSKALLLQDIEGSETEGYDILFSNLQGEGQGLNNFFTVRKLLQRVNIEKLDLKVLDKVFKSFLDALKYTPVYKAEEFQDIPLGVTSKQPILFSFDGLDWSAKIIRHKWLNNEDNQVWHTYSIKLPNNGYIYNRHNEKKDSNHQILKEDALPLLHNAISAANGFFGTHPVSWRIFYMTNRSRMNIKVKCTHLKAWLQITFEYGYPKQIVTDGWYTKEKMIELLKQ